MSGSRVPYVWFPCPACLDLKTPMWGILHPRSPVPTPPMWGILRPCCLRLRPASQMFPPLPPPLPHMPPVIPPPMPSPCRCNVANTMLPNIHKATNTKTTINQDASTNKDTTSNKYTHLTTDIRKDSDTPMPIHACAHAPTLGRNDPHLGTKRPEPWDETTQTLGRNDPNLGTKRPHPVEETPTGRGVRMPISMQHGSERTDRKQKERREAKGTKLEYQFR